MVLLVVRVSGGRWCHRGECHDPKHYPFLYFCVQVKADNRVGDYGAGGSGCLYQSTVGLVLICFMGLLLPKMVSYPLYCG